MNEKILKDLLRTKLKIIDSVITILPPKIKEQAMGFQRTVLKAVNELTKEYVEDKASCKSKNDLKAINIE